MSEHSSGDQHRETPSRVPSATPPPTYHSPYGTPNVWGAPPSPAQWVYATAPPASYAPWMPSTFATPSPRPSPATFRQPEPASAPGTLPAPRRPESPSPSGRSRSPEKATSSLIRPVSLDFVQGASNGQRKSRACYKLMLVPEDFEYPWPAGTKKPRRSKDEKIEDLLAAARELDVSYGELVVAPLTGVQYEGRGEDRRRVNRALKFSQSVRQSVSLFLQGGGSYRFADYIDAVLHSPYGLPAKTNPERQQAWSLDVDWTTFLFARPALVCFAAQHSADKWYRGTCAGSHSKAGLHALATADPAKNPSTWDGIHSAMNTTRRVAKEKQSYSLAVLKKCCAPKERQRKEDVAKDLDERIELTAVRIIATIDYSHNRLAKCLPLSEGVFLASCRTQQKVFDYDSRLALVAPYKTVCRHLEVLGDQEIATVGLLCWNPAIIPKFIFDNNQRLARIWEPQLGREQKILTGIGATFVEIHGIDPAAYDLRDKLRRKATSPRKDLKDVEQITDHINSDHLDEVFVLQWLLVLVTYVPQLATYKKRVIAEYQSTPCSVRPPHSKTISHSLRSNAYNETIMTELKAAFLDMLSQGGQTAERFFERLHLIGGDGLSYEASIRLLHVLQQEDGLWDSLKILHPYLELWHGQLTNNSRICDTYWGQDNSRDPSTLGRCAVEVEVKKPPNMNKVDYYTYRKMIYDVLEAKMLDCWRLHFEVEDLIEHFANKNTSVPTYTQLKADARELAVRYSSPAAYHDALTGVNFNEFPLGTTWTGVPDDSETDEPLSNTAQPDASTGKKKKSATASNGPDVAQLAPAGDHSLASSCSFIATTMLSREIDLAARYGDPGRAWEAFKRLIFDFAGSSHSRYYKYALEMFCDIELESSDAFKKAFLLTWLLCPSGKPGHWLPGDLDQEHSNLAQDEFVMHKDLAYDSRFVRHVISPNASRLQGLKPAMAASVGLASKSGNHVEPHHRLEIQKLLAVFKETEAHSFRPGRFYDSPTRDVDDYGRGMRRLASGALEKWSYESASATGWAREPEDEPHDSAASPAASASTSAAAVAAAARADALPDVPGDDLPESSRDRIEQHDEEDDEATQDEALALELQDMPPESDDDDDEELAEEEDDDM